jgi:arylsulfatase A-like enzyme
MVCSDLYIILPGFSRRLRENFVTKWTHRAWLVIATLTASWTYAAELPNILIIMGDDIGWTNVSAYGSGIVGYDTPNIDRIAKEGMRFTDYYGEQSCTAGRSAFITGQSPLRTGLTKVGTPGADIGIQDEDPTLAELLKPLGYATAQFGKNHLGDKDKYLPTRHGFDEFFGNLYHLNAEEEPENPDYPKDVAFRKVNGPRGVLHSYSDGNTEDTGPLNKKRMETVDEEFLQGSLDFMERSVKADKPFFTWFNSTRMHFYTHIKPESVGISGQNFYGDGMVEHDGHVGQLLDKLDELGIADNTIVVYTTDNGPHFNAWPDAGLSPFRGEKNTNWEGGYRVPALVRWPGIIEPGTISHEIMSHLDWLPTLLAAAGEPKIRQKLLSGHKAGEKTFKVFLDGHNFMPYFTGKAEKGPRDNFFYFSDDGLLTGLRHEDWKFVFAEQRAKTFDVWSDPFVILRIPKVFHLRRDPFERADTDSNTYNDWWIRHAPLIFHARPVITRFVFSFQRFPQRQRPASFTVDQIMEVLDSFSTEK